LPPKKNANKLGDSKTEEKREFVYISTKCGRGKGPSPTTTEGGKKPAKLAEGELHGR